MTLDLRHHPRSTLVGAGVIVLLAVVLIVVFALVPYPELPTVADQPEPALTTELAFVRYDREPCIGVVDAAGEERELVCGSDAEGFGLVWLDDRTLEFQRFGAVVERVNLDAVTGQITVVASSVTEPEGPPVRGPGDPGSAVNGQGDQLVTNAADGAVALTVRRIDGSTDELLALEGPRNYRLSEAVWSADGAWAVVRDSIDRVIVVRTEGDPVPRVWFQDVGEIAVR